MVACGGAVDDVEGALVVAILLEVLNGRRIGFTRHAEQVEDLDTVSSRRTPPLPVPSALSSLVKYPPPPSSVGSSTTPSNPPVRKGGEANGGEAGDAGGNGLSSHRVGVPTDATDTNCESAFITVTMYVGSDALTETLLKLSTTERDPLALSDTTFTLK